MRPPSKPERIRTRVARPHAVISPAHFALLLLTLAAMLLAASSHAATPRRTAKTSAAKKTITIDVVNADIRNVLRLFSDLAKVNVVIDESVSGTVTVKLRNVPWDKALRVILQTKGLGMERTGTILRVAPQETLDAQRGARLDRYAACMATAPLRTRMIPVNYGSAEAMAKVVASTLTERGTVAVDQRTNVLIVRDVHCRR